MGLIRSTSTEICDGIALVFPKVIAEGPIPLEKQEQDHAKIVDVERIKPITQVNKTLFGEREKGAVKTEITGAFQVAPVYTDRGMTRLYNFF